MLAWRPVLAGKAKLEEMETYYSLLDAIKLNNLIEAEADARFEELERLKKGK